jgi:hypothetical protein
MPKKSFRPLLKVVLVCVMAWSFAFSSFAGNANAEQPEKLQGPTGQFQEMAKNFNETTEVVSKKKEKELIELTKKSLNNGEIKLEILEQNKMNFKDAIVTSLENGNFFVKVSAKGKNAVEEFNGFSVVFSQSEKLISTFEVNLVQLNEETASLKTWFNGEKVSDVVLEKPDVQPQWSWSYFQNCLSSQGISWAVVAALGFVCGAACAGSGGALCAPCLYAGSSITGGTIGYCLGKALRK